MEFRWQVIPETHCSDECGSFGEREMRSDRGSRIRMREDDDRVERVGWMVKSSRRYVGWEDCREL